MYFVTTNEDHKKLATLNEKFIEMNFKCELLICIYQCILRTGKFQLNITDLTEQLFIFNDIKVYNFFESNFSKMKLLNANQPVLTIKAKIGHIMRNPPKCMKNLFEFSRMENGRDSFLEVYFSKEINHLIQTNFSEANKIGQLQYAFEQAQEKYEIFIQGKVDANPHRKSTRKRTLAPTFFNEYSPEEIETKQASEENEIEQASNILLSWKKIKNV